MIYGLYLYGKSIGIREWKDGCGGIKFYWLNEGIYQILVPNPTIPKPKPKNQYQVYQIPTKPTNTKYQRGISSPFSVFQPFILLKIVNHYAIYSFSILNNFWSSQMISFSSVHYPNENFCIFTIFTIPILCIYCFVLISSGCFILIWWKFLPPSLSTVIA